MLETRLAPDLGDLPARFAPLFARLAASPSLQGRFANALSLMEYVGARKILKGVPAHLMDQELLGHASEEIRHALLLKRLALKIDPSLTSYLPIHVLGGAAPERYLQAVDRAAEAELGADAGPRERVVNYLYTTLLIEERAQGFYPLYAQELDAIGQGNVARAILREEEGHLSAVLRGLLQQDPSLEQRLPRLRIAEAEAFAAWLAALTRSASQQEVEQSWAS
jgi:hypothetical protein